MASVYDPAFCERIPGLMAEGWSHEECAAELGIGYRTWKRWNSDETEHPEFREAVIEGDWLSKAWWSRFMRQAAQAIVPCQPAMAIFNMKNRHGWRDVTEVNNTGTVRYVIAAPAPIETTEAWLDSVRKSSGNPRPDPKPH